MAIYEFKVIPAPRKGLKIKGARTAEERFAQAMQEAMNTLGAQGWDYVRTDTLPSEEREGLMGKTTVYQNMLVFRRETADSAAFQLKQETAQADALRELLASLRPAPQPAEAAAPPAPPQAPDAPDAKPLAAE